MYSTDEDRLPGSASCSRDTLSDYLSDESYGELQRALMENPDTGALMPGAGGFRKESWDDARRGNGKRGGLRLSAWLFDQCHSSVHRPTVETDYLLTASVEGRSGDNCVSKTAGVLFR